VQIGLRPVQRCKCEDSLGSQVSALRYLVRVIRCRYRCGIIQILNLYPNLNTCTRLPTAETRDLKSFPAKHPVSGFPLS
jgi:hypothetical protein